MLGLTSGQQDLYKQLEEAIRLNRSIANFLKGVSKDDLLKVLTTSDGCMGDGSGLICSTPLGYTMKFYDSEPRTKAILDVARDNSILKEVLTTANIYATLMGGSVMRNATPLGFAIASSQESIEAILGAAREQDILKEVLTANITVEFNGGGKHTVTPLGLATEQHKVEAILNAAEGLGILKEVFVVIEKDDRESIKTILQKAGNHNMLDKIEKSMSENGAVKENQPSSENEKQPPENTAKTKQITNKPIVIGGVCGVIAALAVIGGCFAAGVALPILAIAGIAVAAALVVGLIAGGITYMLSELPSGKVKEANTQKLNVNDSYLPR